MNIMQVVSRISLRSRHVRKARASISVISTIVLAVSAMHTSQALAQNIEPGDIAPFIIVYEVGNHLINAGTARVSLTKDGDIWSYRLKTTPRGILKLAGKGRIDEASTIRFAELDGKLWIQPQTYSFRQDGERRRAVDASFDWENKTVTHVYRGKQVTETFEGALIDRLSATLLMMNTLRQEFDSQELQVFDTARVKNVAFIKLGNETLDTKLGPIETIRVLNKNATGGSRETTTWFAPSLDYVPVKIEHRKRGELVARLSLLRLENRVTDIKLEATPD